jgi:DNA recombination protein RmuC
MRTLATRDYPEAITESLKGHVLDLTLIFMPSEASFSAAVIQDSELWAEALRQRIIIVSPTTLLATLRVVAQIWRVEKQNRNAAAIAKEAGGIVEKLRGALEDFDDVEKAMQTALEAFGKARGKLVSGKGNIIRKAEKLIRLGAPAKDETKARITEEGDEEEDNTDSLVGHVPPPNIDKP